MKLKFYVDCSALHDIPYAIIPLPVNHYHNYVFTRADLSQQTGKNFEIAHPSHPKQPYRVNIKNVVAKPAKTSRWPEALLSTILACAFVAFLVYMQDFDIDLYRNIALAFIGLSFITGLFFADCRIRSQQTLADRFNKSIVT